MKQTNLFITAVLTFGLAASARDFSTLTLKEHAVVAAAQTILQDQQSRSYGILVAEMGEVNAKEFVQNILRDEKNSNFGKIGILSQKEMIETDVAKVKGPKKNFGMIASGKEPWEVTEPLRDLEPTNPSAGGCGGKGTGQSCTNEKVMDPYANFGKVSNFKL